MTQSFRRIKIDINDTLYSQLIRAGHEDCLRCGRFVGFSKLQCAHIMGRGNYNTRFMIRPIINAVYLCSTCHDWFDTHKDDTPIFKEVARPYISPEENRWAWLISTGFYTWQNLKDLHVLASLPFQHYKFKKKSITEKLRLELKSL